MFENIKSLNKISYNLLQLSKFRKISYQYKNFSSAKKRKTKSKCPNNTCKDLAGPKRSGIFSIFKRKKPLVCCEDEGDKILPKGGYVQEKDVDGLKVDKTELEALGGEIFKTCGTAYIVQKSLSKKMQAKSEAYTERKILERIETPKGVKDVQDPYPEFTSAEDRLIELNDKGLHPSYKKFLYMTKKEKSYPKFEYTNCACSKYNETTKLNCHPSIIEKKNIPNPIKLVEPPDDLIDRLIEQNRNSKPTFGEPQK